VFLIGGGPGAPDLVTVRGARAIAASDIVIWGRPMSTEELVREHARPGAEIVAWPPATMADLEAAYDRAAAAGLTVARLHGGDPGVYARLYEELVRVRTRGLEVEIIPGVTAACAAAAALEWELSSEAERRPVVLAAGKGPDGAVAPELERAAAGGHALALYIAGGIGAELQATLLERGYPAGTECAIATRVSWPGETLERCSLAQLRERLERLESAGARGGGVVLVAAAEAAGDKGGAGAEQAAGAAAGICAAHLLSGT
jgi:precorrin-4/cobalt-precorrin-4 C11-methyltransferase